MTRHARRVAAPRARDERGFTLIEALVALAVTAAGLAAIGQLGFSTLSAARRAETRLALAATARKALVAVTESRSAPRAFSGRIDADAWRLQSSPFRFDAPGAPGAQGWAPEAVRLMIVDPSGAEIAIDTVRLRPTGPAP